MARQLTARTTAMTLLVAIALAVGLPTGAAHAWSFNNSQVAAKSRSYAIGARGGQCKVWAATVVNAVLASNGIAARVGGYGSPGGAYYGAYQNAGGVLVGINDGQPGDLIQTINPAQRNSDSPAIAGLHTAIIVERTATAGRYIVRDSNWNLDELVREHEWAPATWASSKGAAAYVWRFGSAATPVTQPSRNVFFVKIRNSTSGRVEVHTAAAGSGWSSGVSSTTRFGVADGGNGTWGVLPGGDVFFVKTRNTTSGRVEIHTATAASGWSSGVSSTTRFGLADGGNGMWGVPAA